VAVASVMTVEHKRRKQSFGGQQFWCERKGPDTGFFASKRLSLILEGGKSRRNPEKELDQIYAKILSDSIRGDYDEDKKKKVFELFRKIIRVIMILFNPLSAAALSELLYKPRVEVS
jgi:hypothetical protein